MSTTTSTSAYGAHHTHMLSVLHHASLSQPATIEDLLGDADIDDPKIILGTRTFIATHRNLNIRVSDFDAHIANLRRAAKRAARGGTSTADERHAEVFAWVADQFEALGVTVDCAGNIRAPRHDAVTLPAALTVLNADRGKSNAYPEGAVKAATGLLIAERRAAALDVLRDHLSGRHLTIARDVVMRGLEQLLDIGMADDNAFTPAQAALLIAKTIWQVKRKLADIRVSHHTMLIVVGPQGGGKSTLVEMLVEPLREVTVNTNLAAITDDRNISLFNSYVGVIDELDKADKASVESLKRVITDHHISRRPMRENSLVNVRQRLTFIGTSNKDVAESIHDETGNRRLVQFTLIGPADARRAAFWQAARDFDWLSLWRAIDETGDDPTAAIMETIGTVQAAERNRSFIELWIECLVENRDAIVMREAFTKSRVLYQQYRLWEDDYAPQFKTNISTFQKTFARLARHGVIPFVAKHRAVGNGYEYTGAKR